MRVVRFYVSCLLLPPASSSSSSSPPRPPRPPCHPCRPRCPRRPRRPRRPHRPCSTATRDPQCSLPDLNREYPCQVEVRQGTLGMDTRRCSLPDLNHDQPRPVFPAGPHLRVSMPSVPCRTSTASIHAKRYAT